MRGATVRHGRCDTPVSCENGLLEGGCRTLVRLFVQNRRSEGVRQCDPKGGERGVALALASPQGSARTDDVWWGQNAARDPVGRKLPADRQEAKGAALAQAAKATRRQPKHVPEPSHPLLTEHLHAGTAATCTDALQRRAHSDNWPVQAPSKHFGGPASNSSTSSSGGVVT